jgi:hypothetical protein
MMLMTMDNALELGNALLAAADLMKSVDVTTVSIEIYNGLAVAVQGSGSDHTIIQVIDTLPI